MITENDDDENPLADHWTPAPLSQATIDDLRAAAEKMPGNRGRLLRLQADYQQSIRDAHRASTLGDAEAHSAAILERCRCAGAIEAAQDEIADDFGSSLSLFIDRRPRHPAFTDIPEIKLWELWELMKHC